MFHIHHHKALLCFVTLTISPPSQSPLQSLLSLKFSTVTSGTHSFAVSYLINNFGFSPDSALKASKEVRFRTSEKPDSVRTFLRNHGFPTSQIHHIIGKAPWILSCNPDKTILPKFEFLLSKGASESDIVLIVTKESSFLRRSLWNHIVPTYALLRELLQSDERTIACIKLYSLILYSPEFQNNVKLLRDRGVTGSNIAKVLFSRPSMLCSSTLEKAVEAVQELGFDPSKSAFNLALMAKNILSKVHWDEKVAVYKKWGWTEEAVLGAFRLQPICMLRSTDKINAVMSYWVNELGWNSLTIAKGSAILGYSLQKRIIPRASVLQFLRSKVLINKNVCLITPFHMNEKLFLQKFVTCYKEETSQLLMLYEENKKESTRELFEVTASDTTLYAC